MSVKKQVPSLCKLFSFHEEPLEEFLDEIDVDSCFYHNTFDISLSQHRIVGVSIGSNKRSFALKLLQFCNLRRQQRFILQEELKISRRKLGSLFHSLRDSLKTFDKANNCLQIPLQKPKIERGSTKSKKNIFAHKYKDIIEHRKNLFVYRSDLKTTKLASFP